LNSGDFAIKTQDELATLRAALAARLDGCWIRLDDVVSELTALHEVPLEAIVERVHTTIKAEGQR